MGDLLPEVFQGNKNYSPSVRRYLEANGNKKIVSLLVVRAPVQSAITTALSWLSLGKFEEAQKKEGYDHFYHLSLIGTYEDGSKVMMEKLAQISIKGCSGPPAGAETMAVGKILPLTLNKLLDKARKSAGDQGWFEYGAFDNNCQKWVGEVLQAVNRYSGETKKFAFQDVSTLIKSQPSYLERVARTATDLGAIGERVINGSGLGHRGIVRNVLAEFR